LSARHRTTLLTTAGNCFVHEDRSEIVSRIRAAAEGDGWFEATADPEREPIWVNARNVAIVSRERTPLEAMHMAPPPTDDEDGA